MHIIFTLTLLTFCTLSSHMLMAREVAPSLPDKGVASKDFKGFLDPKIDYSKMTMRITDLSSDRHIVKVKAENANVKFLKAGDKLAFSVGEKGERYCYGNVRQVEPFHVVMYVNNFNHCTKKDSYMRRGTILFFNSPILKERIVQGAQFREHLLLKKSDLLKQLSQINHFVWTFEQQRMKLAAEYDQRIVELQKEKRKALDEIFIEKRDKLILQTELQKHLSQLDESLKHYNVERQEFFSDRWNMGHDLGLPLGKRPQKVKKKAQNGDNINL